MLNGFYVTNAQGKTICYCVNMKESNRVMKILNNPASQLLFLDAVKKLKEEKYRDLLGDVIYASEALKEFNK